MASTPGTPTAPIRTAIVRLTIVSFSAAALLGVVALLGGGAFGETEGRILLSTLVIGVVSVAVLCYLATAGTPYQPVGIAGGAVVLVPLVTVLVMIWAYFDTDPPEIIAKAFGVGAILAATLAQASLLLVMAEHRRPAVRRLLAGTLVMATALAGLLSALVVGLDPRGGYLRVVGVVAILDVLGTVVVAALTRFGAQPQPAQPDDLQPARRDQTLVGADAARRLSLPAELGARLDAVAARTGLTPDEVVATALRLYLEPQDLAAAPAADPGARSPAAPAAPATPGGH